MRRANAVVGGIGIVVSFVVVREAVSLGVMREGIPEAGFLPLVTGIWILALGVLLLIGSGTGGGDAAPWPSRPKLLRVGQLLFGLGAQLLLMPWLGFATATAAFLACAVRWLGGHSWLGALAIGVGLAVVLDLVFTRILGVPLPKASLWGR